MLLESKTREPPVSFGMSVTAPRPLVLDRKNGAAFLTFGGSLGLLRR